MSLGIGCSVIELLAQASFENGKIVLAWENHALLCRKTSGYEVNCRWLCPAKNPACMNATKTQKKKMYLLYWTIHRRSPRFCAARMSVESTAASRAVFSISKVEVEWNSWICGLGHENAGLSLFAFNAISTNRACRF